MNEVEWLASTAPKAMLEHLRRQCSVTRRPAGRRKLRLFGCACCRRAWPLMGVKGQRTVEVAERFADGLASRDELLQAHNAVRWGHVDVRQAAAIVSAPEAWRAARAWLRTSVKQYAKLRGTSTRQERCAQASLVRCIFGNAFRPLAPRPFPGHVVELARECYEGFPAVSNRFLILADALADLGEEGAAQHCREGEHAKGCHVLDWVLSRK